MMERRKLRVLATGERSQESVVEYLRSRGHEVFVSNGPEYTRALERAQREQTENSDANFKALHDHILEGLLRRRFVVSGRDVTRELASAYLRKSLPGIVSFQIIWRGFQLFQDEYKVDIFLTHNEEAANLRLLVTASRYHGVRTLHLPHGFGPRVFEQYAYHDFIRVDKVAVESANTGEVMFLTKPYNRPEQLAVVGGRFEWDEYVHTELPAVPEALASMGLDPNRPSLGIAGTWLDNEVGDDQDRVFRSLFYIFEAVRRMGDAAPQVIVRPHPGSFYSGSMLPDVYRAIASRVGIDIVISETDIDSFLAASTAVLSFQSTVNGLTLLTGRRCISLEWSRDDPLEEPIVWGTLPGVRYCVNDFQDIVDALDDTYRNQAKISHYEAMREQTLRIINGPNDGCVRERVESLMMSMVFGEGNLARVAEEHLEEKDVQLDQNPAGEQGHHDVLCLQVTSANRWLFVPDWSNDQWQATVRDFIRHFRAVDDVALIVRVEPTSEEMVSEVVTILQRLLDESDVPIGESPAILIEATPLTAAERPSLFRACTGIVRSSGHLLQGYAEQAAAYGLTQVDGAAWAGAESQGVVQEQPSTVKQQSVLVSNRAELSNHAQVACYSSTHAVEKSPRIVLVGA